MALPTHDYNIKELGYLDCAIRTHSFTFSVPKMVTVTEMGTTQPEKEQVRGTITVPHAANYTEATQLNLDDLFKFKPTVSFQQPRIGEKVFLRKSIGDLEEGSTVTVVHQLSEIEFVRQSFRNCLMSNIEM